MPGFAVGQEDPRQDRACRASTTGGRWVPRRLSCSGERTASGKRAASIKHMMAQTWRSSVFDARGPCRSAIARALHRDPWSGTREERKAFGKPLFVVRSDAAAHQARATPSTWPCRAYVYSTAQRAQARRATGGRLDNRRRSKLVLRHHGQETWADRAMQVPRRPTATSARIRGGAPLARRQAPRDRPEEPRSPPEETLPRGPRQKAAFPW